MLEESAEGVTAARRASVAEVMGGEDCVRVDLGARRCARGFTAEELGGKEDSEEGGEEEGVFWSCIGGRSVAGEAGPAEDGAIGISIDCTTEGKREIPALEALSSGAMVEA